MFREGKWWYPKTDEEYLEYKKETINSKIELLKQGKFVQNIDSEEEIDISNNREVFSKKSCFERPEINSNYEIKKEKNEEKSKDFEDEEKNDNNFQKNYDCGSISEQKIEYNNVNTLFRNQKSNSAIDLINEKLEDEILKAESNENNENYKENKEYYQNSQENNSENNQENYNKNNDNEIKLKTIEESIENLKELTTLLEG